MGIPRHICSVVMAIIAITMPLPLSAQWTETFNYKGSWSDWQSGNNYHDYAYLSPTDDGNTIEAYADGSGLILKTSGKITYFDFQISNYRSPDKKEIKEHLKSNEWFVYSGIVSYYVNDQYPTAEAIAKNAAFVKPNPRVDQTPNVKRTANATIKIAPYEKAPYCYNILFDNVGIGISVRGLKFGGQKRK